MSSRLSTVVHVGLCIALLGTVVGRGAHAVGLGLAILAALVDLIINPASRATFRRRWQALPIRHAWYLLWGASLLSWIVTAWEYSATGTAWTWKPLSAISLDLTYLLTLTYFGSSDRAMRRFGSFALITAFLSAALTLSFGTYRGVRLRPLFITPWFRYEIDSVVRYTSALTIILLFALAVYLWDRTRGRPWATRGQLLLGFAAFAVVGTMIGCQVRGAFLGAALGALFLARQSDLRWLVVAIVSIAAVAAFAVASLFSGENLSEAVTVRQDMFRPALREFARRPLLGHGLADRKELEAAGHMIDPHNSILNMAVRRGIIAAAAQTLIILTTLLMLVRLHRRTPVDDRRRPWIDGAIAAAIVVLVFSTTQGGWFAPQFRVVVGWHLAFIVCLERAGARSEIEIVTADDRIHRRSPDL